jgi:enamine deaminase RidA (YjgF/YER057c/UK114 family)
MDKVKQLVQNGGGTVDSILQLTVFLADIKYYDGMNQVFKTYFPNGGPARTTVAVAALPGNSLVEINCVRLWSRSSHKRHPCHQPHPLHVETPNGEGFWGG